MSYLLWREWGFIFIVLYRRPEADAHLGLHAQGPGKALVLKVEEQVEIFDPIPHAELPDLARLFTTRRATNGEALQRCGAS